MWKEEEYGHDKCINCGYLGKKDTLGLSQECYIANAEERTTGNLAYHTIITKIRFDTVPWCYVGKANLKDEIGQLDSQIKGVARTLNIIEKDRHCPSWYVWREFSSPKEQWEESVMLAMEKRREDFERELFEISQQVQSDSAKVAERADKFNRRVTWFFIALALLGVVGTFLTLAYPNGFIWPSWLIRLLG